MHKIDRSRTKHLQQQASPLVPTFESTQYHNAANFKPTNQTKQSPPPLRYPSTLSPPPPLPSLRPSPITQTSWCLTRGVCAFALLAGSGSLRDWGFAMVNYRNPGYCVALCHQDWISPVKTRRPRMDTRSRKTRVNLGGAQECEIQIHDAISYPFQTAPGSACAGVGEGEIMDHHSVGWLASE